MDLQSAFFSGAQNLKTGGIATFSLVCIRLKLSSSSVSQRKMANPLDLGDREIRRRNKSYQNSFAPRVSPSIHDVPTSTVNIDSGTLNSANKAKM